MNKVLLNKIHKLFGISVDNFMEVETGVYSENKILVDKNNNKYFLKKYRNRPIKRINTIHEVMFYFNDKGLPVNIPIKTASDESHFTIDDNTYTLFPFIDGNQLNHNEITEIHSAELGRVLASFHLSGHSFNLGNPEIILKKEKSLEQKLKKFDIALNFINNKKKKGEFDEFALDHIKLKQTLFKKYWDSYKLWKLPHNTLLHGDYHLGNVFFDSKNRIIDVFDFDNAKIFYEEAELVWCIFISFLQESFETNQELIIKFLSSYKKVRSISKENFSKAIRLYFFGLISTVWAEEEYYLHKNKRVKSIVEKNDKRIRYLDDNLDEFCSRLVSYM